jgi:hypothetical protein
MTAKEYKSLGVAERRVFFIAALVPVDIGKDVDAVRSGEWRRSQ